MSAINEKVLEVRNSRTYLVVTKKRRAPASVPALGLTGDLPFPVHSKSIFTLDGVVLAFDPSFDSVKPGELL
jgi:hypothetical protein